MVCGSDFIKQNSVAIPFILDIGKDGNDVIYKPRKTII
jgi:hypothetical protein